MSEKNKPIIFSIDDDPQVLHSLKRDLRAEFKKDYRIISTDDIKEGLEALTKLKKRGDEVALLLSDQRMPDMLGVDFLEKARKVFPRAKRVLLTAYSDTDAAIKAINDVQLDYYLMKPWNPPAEKLYPVLNDLLDEWQLNYRPAFKGIRVVGYQYSPKSHNIKDFLAGNLRPYQWLDYEKNPKAKDLLELYESENVTLPAVFFEEGDPLFDPPITELAERVGMSPTAQSDIYDTVIIGAGPAGLAAGVYGGSEGLKTLIIEKRAPGGQAGTSSRIENYLGFPKGLSGADLARRALTQTTRFGVEFLSPREVMDIKVENPYKVLRLDDDSVIHARTVVITTGVDYRRLPAEGVEEFTGAGVYYGAATTEAGSCQNMEVFVVGGGNSAGQGAVYLSQYAKKVSILIRREDLTSSMSSYLIDQIDQIDNIEVKPFTEVVKACGDEHLERLVIRDIQQDTTSDVEAGGLFIFIGARPHTNWLEHKIIRDSKGFIETGNNLRQKSAFRKTWKLDREPFLLETCIPGVFAAGDVRAGAMNRVASAVGEGAMAIKFVHEYLATI